MVFRKPYALLIKYFKIIHIVITIFMIYLTYKTVNLYKFFASYVKTGWSSLNAEEINSYIGPLIFISIFIIVILALVIFFLMRFKNKPRVYYLLTPITYLILLIIFIYTLSVLKTAEFDVVSPITSRITRDILMIAIGIQFLFIVFSLFRAIGFDIKKFNFKQDIADLQIGELDNEEVELNLEVDKYKMSRIAKRRIRNISYIFKEHKFIFSLLLFIVFGSLITYFALNKFVLSPTYKEGKQVDLGNYNIIINKSYVTNKDYKGKIINKNNKYILVSFSIINKIQDMVFNMNNVSLNLNDKIYYPVTNIYSDFIDIGNGYIDQKLNTKKDNNYFLVFKIPNEEKINNPILQYTISKKYDKNNNLQNKYKKFKLNPISDETITIIEKKLHENSNIFGNELLINEYNINNKFEYSYKLCTTNNNCENKTYQVNTENSLDNSLILRLNISATMGEYNNSSIKNLTDFIEKFGSITYTLNNQTYNQSNLNLLNTNTFNGNEIFINIPSRIKDSSNIYLDINIRNIKYRYKLK